jgi:hypothetical protein
MQAQKAWGNLLNGRRPRGQSRVYLVLTEVHVEHVVGDIDNLI